MPTLKDVSAWLAGAPLPEDLFDYLLDEGERQRILQARITVDSCLAGLSEHARVGEHDEIVELAITLGIAMEQQRALRAEAERRANNPAPLKRRPGRPKTYNFDAIRRRAPPRGRDPMSRERLNRFLAAKERDAAEYHAATGRRISDKGYWEYLASKDPNVRPRDRNKLVQYLAHKTSEARQKFNVPLRKKRSNKSGSHCK